MCIAVTGGAGFIGGHLVRRLAAIRAGRILVLDNLQRACMEDPRVGQDNVSLVQVDIRNREALSGAFEGCKVVFHLAAQSNVMGAVSNSGYAFDTNVAGTFNVLEAAKSAGVKRFVFTSSREVYGEPDQLPVGESSSLHPKNAYGASKAAGEVYCRLAAVEGMEAVILRLANVYGPGDRDRVVPLFLEAARAGSPLTIYGGDQVLDLVWIDIVVEAMIKAAFGDWLREPVNIGSGVGVRLPDLARRITELTRSAAPIRIVPKRKQEVERFVADVTRGRELLGIQPPEDPMLHLPLLMSAARYPVQHTQVHHDQYSKVAR